MANDKMTERDFLNGFLKGENSAEMVNYAQDRIAKLDERNSKRKNTPTKTQVENEGIKANIFDYVSGNANSTASAIAAACDISTQKASALCAQMVAAGKFTVADVKAKKGTVKAYSVAIVAE